MANSTFIFLKEQAVIITIKEHQIQEGGEGGERGGEAVSLALKEATT